MKGEITMDVQNIKQVLDREYVLAILTFLGYRFNRDQKFMLRDEKTPSCSIRRDGYIKDFGSGWGGDIFALLQEYHGLTFPEAVEYVSECLGGGK